MMHVCLAACTCGGGSWAGGGWRRVRGWVGLRVKLVDSCIVSSLRCVGSLSVVLCVGI